jgi:hypothetical protein
MQPNHVVICTYCSTRPELWSASTFTSQYITGLVSTCMGDHVVNLPLHFPYLTAIDTNIVMTTMMVIINLLTLINADYAFVVMLDQGRCAWW